MSEFFIKICGIRDLPTARVAMDAGASALGFMFAESSRRTTPVVSSAIKGELGVGPVFVGVTVNATPDELSTLIRDASLDAIQLSGDESPNILDDIDVPVIKAFRFPLETHFESARRSIDGWMSHPRAPKYVLIDGHVGGAYGGTGVQADFTLARELAREFPVILAGGLTSTNVINAIHAVAPSGVDVSSGVETARAKDPHKIQAFIQNAIGASQ